MAIDTAEKRRSAQYMAVPSVLPVATGGGADTVGERAHVAGYYAGIAYVAASAGGGGTGSGLTRDVLEALRKRRERADRDRETEILMVLLAEMSDGGL